MQRHHHGINTTSKQLPGHVQRHLHGINISKQLSGHVQRIFMISAQQASNCQGISSGISMVSTRQASNCQGMSSGISIVSTQQASNSQGMSNSRRMVKSLHHEQILFFKVRPRLLFDQYQDMYRIRICNTRKCIG